MQPPQPIESQSKSPINIDLESSPQAAPAPPTPKKQAAPVPDMDVNMSNGATTEKGPAVKNEEESAKAETQPPTGTAKPEAAAVKTEAEQEAPAPAADDPSNLLDSNFTDMEFSLAPTAEDTNGANQNDSSSMPTFDLTSFAPNDSNDSNVISLDALESATQQPQSTQAEAPAAATTTTATADTKTEEEKKKETNAKFEEIFGNDGSQADGMDFDFSLDGGGMGDDTFDDLMNDRDGTFEMMNNEDFDAAFFGLDGSNTES